MGNMLKSLLLLFFLGFSTAVNGAATRTCTISPLGKGKDDTDQVLKAIDECGKNGRTVLQKGNYNITRKMTWNLENAQVDLYGTLNFVPNIEYWLDMTNTYQVVFIQSQSSWFVLTGKDFVVDAHNEGGIEGNGQPWWEYFQSHTREDGDGRPLSLTVFEAERGTVRNFRIQSPPFWCNCVANSKDVLYDGMICNATNTNPAFFGENITPNTDGIDTYRSDSITLRNWDVTCGDDCLAIKGNSTNIVAQGITCRGGNGIAFGSLGQYVQFNDIVDNVLLEDINVLRIDESIQPLMRWGVYFKSWTGSVIGVPPTGGGGSGGFVKNVVAKNVHLSSVDTAVAAYQTYGGNSSDTPSFFNFRDLTFEDWSGTASTNTLVDLECSANAPCSNISFKNLNVKTPNNETPNFVCVNVESESGLPGPCNPTPTTTV
ncbi:pectin lyase-like protein [Fomitiporia mediterranea MF3/22]|uniref:pectin lyase-like protein n=1 Tax=Fomitiporia mediterranea (strain MF3/22) TaxID=694068 RepID=UPI0004409195|nr:pectin lyase-like protein [Fomitiporia mediterranea MF3/22]EJC98108.1 pectin lyase-like protein [Fomitiporia mediterranea MF3/22]